MADVSIHAPAVAAVPSGYTVAGNLEIVLKGVTATFDGTGAAGSFIPAVQIVDPSGTVAGTYTCGTTLAAGASADVSWFPSVGGGSSSSPTHSTKQIAVPLDTPDSSGNGYPAVSTANGFTNVRRVVPAFTHSVDGTWEGGVVIPQDYASSAALILSLVANNTTAAKAARFFVSTSVVANGSSEDPSYTAETAVNIAVPTTAKQRFDQSYTLSTSPVAGSTLNVKVTRNGSNVADTLTTLDVLLWACVFQYSS